MWVGFSVFVWVGFFVFFFVLNFCNFAVRHAQEGEHGWP